MISHHHRTIFVHIPKCGGSSVEALFLKDLGLQFHERAPLLLRSRIGGELGPPSLTHLLAREFTSGHYISEELFDSYFKFAVVRNPIARARSTYKYLGARYLMSMDRFVVQHLVPGATDASHPLHWFFRPQSDFVVIGGALAVDEVLRLESIDEHIEAVATKARLSTHRLPHENSSDARPTGSPARSAARAVVRFGMRPGPDFGRDELSAKGRSLLEVAYSRDFDAFGY